MGGGTGDRRPLKLWMAAASRGVEVCRVRVAVGGGQRRRRPEAARVMSGGGRWTSAKEAGRSPDRGSSGQQGWEAGG